MVRDAVGTEAQGHSTTDRWMGSLSTSGRPMTCSRARFQVVNSRGLQRGGSRSNTLWRAWIAHHTAATCVRDAPYVIRSHVIAFSVSFDTGRSRCMAFRTMAQVTTKDQFAQFFERVEDYVVDGKMYASNATVSSARDAERPDPPT